jgi:hypothetical protein
MTWTSGEATRYGAPVLPDSVKMLTTPRGLGFAAVGPLAQHRAGRGVDGFLDGAGSGPFAVDPVLGDLAHVRGSFGGS